MSVRADKQRARWVYNLGSQVFEANCRNVQIIDPGINQISDDDLVIWDIAYRILPSLGSTILNNDSASVDFPVNDNLVKYTTTNTICLLTRSCPSDLEVP
jgi:hypothetical protein